MDKILTRKFNFVCCVRWNVSMGVVSMANLSWQTSSIVDIRKVWRTPKCLFLDNFLQGMCQTLLSQHIPCRKLLRIPTEVFWVGVFNFMSCTCFSSSNRYTEFSLNITIIFFFKNWTKKNWIFSPIVFLLFIWKERNKRKKISLYSSIEAQKHSSKRKEKEKKSFKHGLLFLPRWLS